MVFPSMQQGLVKSGSSEAASGSGDAQAQSTATRRPTPQAVGAHGAPHLPFGFALKPSPSAPWDRGLLPAFWNGGPQTCLPTARGVAPPAALYGPSSPANTQDPREGPSLVRQTTQDLLKGGLARLAREERTDQGEGAPREVRLALISPPLVSQPGEAAPEEVLRRPPCEAWPLARV